METYRDAGVTDPRLPAAIGRYRPLAVLGAGAMGVVYKAHDPVIDRLVAVKLVQTDALDADTRDEYLARFRQEVQAAGRCVHPAIVAVYDYSDDAAQPFIVMEFVEGQTLRQVLRDPAARATLDPCALLVQVLDGLAYAHARQVTHRDVKPANIMVTPGRQAKIMDFGIARLSGTDLTQAGGMLGTPSYMAPEQVTGRAVDHRADLFAVGCVLYEALVGHPPFAGRTVSETVLRLTGPGEAAMAPVEAAGRAALVPLLRRALAKEPAERFPSAQEFAAALLAASGRSHAPPGDHEGTVVLAGAAPGGATGGRAPPLRWDPALLQQVERSLAGYLGPMARVAVEQAVAAARSSDELFRALIAHLPDPRDRSAFLRSVAAGRVEPSITRSGTRTGDGSRTGGGSLTAPPTATQSPHAAPAYTPEVLDAAQTALAYFMGPIARVLVRQAASDAPPAREFLDRLTAHVTKPADAAALRRRLEADVAPRLLGRR